MNPSLPTVKKQGHLKRKLVISILLLLLIIPSGIYLVSALMKPKPPLEASFIADPKEITAVDDAKGIDKKNYSKIYISYKNNTNSALSSLKVFIPKSVINDAGPGIKGFSDRRVPINFKAARENGKLHIVLELPDIKVHEEKKVELVSFFSKKTGSMEIIGDVRTSDGLKAIANPATVIVK